MAETGEQAGLEDQKDLGTGPTDIAARWILELQSARKGPYQRWLAKARKATKRYRDEDMQDDGVMQGSTRRNAQFNVLWSNIQTIAPGTYSKPPVPVVERRYLDRDVVGRAASTILQRTLANQIEASEFHEVMKQCRTDYFLVALASAWVRYEATYDKPSPQHQDEKALEKGAAGDELAYEPPQKPKSQKICVDYCHWGDELFSPVRYWQELEWRAKRAYYKRSQLVKKFGKEIGSEVPLKTSRGKKQNDIAGSMKEVIGKAEVWQIWDFEERQIVYICEDYAAAPLKVVKQDALGLECFTPSARPARGTTTNDTLYPVPDYTIWGDQAGELDNLTARIAALTRAIKACGVYDGSVPELERLLNEGMENKLIATRNWAKMTQKGGLPGAMSLLPIKEMADALTALYLARAQVKNDLYEISGVSDIVRGASDPNETAAAQKMKGQFAGRRSGDRKEEFDRFVRDTLAIMAEIAVEHFTDETLWLMSDFEQWAKDQDLRAYSEAPMMGHNGGPPLDDMAPPMPQAAPSPAPAYPSPVNSLQGVGGMPTPAAPPMPAPGTGNAPIAPGLAPEPTAPAPSMPMASAPITPPIPGLQIPPQAMPGQAPGAPANPPQMPPAPAYDPLQARQLFNRAVALLRDDKLRSFRIQVETDSTIEPDATQDKQARVEFLGAVTAFMAQAQEMAAAYPQMMPVLGKFLLFGARGFRVGRELESSLEALIGDLEKQARNPAPKPPSPDEIKAQAVKDKAEADKELAGIKMQGEQQKLQMEMQRLVAEMQAERQRLQMEMQKLQMELQAKREELQLKREEGQIKVQQSHQEAQIKQVQGEQQLALDAQKGQLEAQGMERQAQNDERQAHLQAEGMEREAEHSERMLGRKEEHETKRMELAEKSAANKAKASAQGAGPGGRR
jgi:hypothetical protein